MLNLLRTPGFRFKTLAALAAILTISAVAGAQTQPQLLPYTVKLLAGGGTAAYAAGAKCPSGLTSTDAYGDGCLATEIQLTSTTTSAFNPRGARYAIADAQGVVYFSYSDSAAGLIRRIDPVTGIVTVFAGGAASSPGSGSPCGSLVSTDARGDGCLSTAVKLVNPNSLAIAPNGDLLFTDVGQYDVRRIAAVAGVLPAASGVISNVAGSTAFGYVVSNATTTINAATQSYLDTPYQVAVDAQGNVYVADEAKNAVLAINTGLTPITIAGTTLAAGSIAKIAGLSTSAGAYCPNGSSGTNGCNFGSYSEGAVANSSYLDAPYGVTVDPKGNVYIANEFNAVVPVVSATGTISTYAGDQTKAAKTTARGVAPFSMGSTFSVAADSYSNLYISDASNGVVWRVDAAGKYQYPVAGGASSACSASTDAFGDGCPGTQAIFGSTGTLFATATAPGVFGVTLDAAGNLYVGDTTTNLVREVSNGTQFGQVGPALTQTLDIHFTAGDTPAANAYALTQTTANFTLGTAACTPNSDTTTDCLLPVTAVAANATNLGAFNATLSVTSTKGGKNTFTLTGTHVQTPVTRTSVTVTPGTTCTGATSYSTATAIALTATITSTGTPGGTVQFYANNSAIGSPVAVSSGTARMTYTFSTPGTYTISATYSGDAYFTSSTGTSTTTITTANPSFSATVATAPTANTIVQGQSAAYSFTLAQNVYSGTLSFSVTGLPANSTAVFSPTTITATGCSASNTVTMTILTQLASQKQAGFGGNGPWRIAGMLAAIVLGAAVAIRRRRLRGMWSGAALMLALLVASSGLMACGKGAQTGVSTPTGTYPLTLTITGTGGATSTVSTSLTVAAYQDPYH